MVAGIGDEDADAAGHGGMAGGGVVAGAAPALLRQGAQPGVASRDRGGVAGVGGVAGRDGRGAFPCRLREPLRLQRVAGVLAGAAAEHEPVVGRGVLAVAALDEPAAAGASRPSRAGLARRVPAAASLFNLLCERVQVIPV